MEEQELRVVKEIACKYKYKLIALIAVTTLAALVLSFILPKEYESTVVIRAKAQKQGGAFSLQAASALALLGGGSMSSPTQVYMELMKSRSVLNPVIASLDLPNKDKIDNKDFSKKYLNIQNTKGTDLIEVTGVGRTPEEAQQIASGVVDSFQQLLTQLNKSEQSLMLKFLGERLVAAKQDMEKAEKDLEAFKQQEKIYIPDEQAKAAVKKLTEYDQKVVQIQVENDANEVKLKGINEQLGRQNAALTQYNVADNPEIQQIRSAIITKQLALLELEQRFTDKNPSVILAKKEIDKLNDKLHEEVGQSVEAGTSSLNPIQAGLLKEKVTAETELMVGRATLAGVKSVLTDNEKEISKLSASSLTYVGLERQVKITQEVYSVLVKNYEQARIQEAMESMDIQVVDSADLPKKPSAPRKSLITAFGFALGVFTSTIYMFILYNRQCQVVGKSNRAVG